jgi:hypothetical protein
MVWAQLPVSSNPYLAPVPPPSGPAQLAAPVPNEGVPSLAPVASPPAATPAPSAQTFNCSCFGPGTSTAWMGSVVSTSYFNAQQTAEGACVAYNERSPSPPVIPSIGTESSASSLPSLPASALPADAASEAAQILPGAIISSQTAVEACERCACS